MFSFQNSTGLLTLCLGAFGLCLRVSLCASVLPRYHCSYLYLYLPRQQLFFLLKSLQYIHRFQNTLCALRPLLHHYHISTLLNPCICVCLVCILSCVCVYACVCAYVCVASQCPLFHKVFFKLFFKSTFYCLHQLLDI